MSWLLGLIGTIIDRPRWLAIVMLTITSLLGLIIFGWPMLSMLCS